MYRKRKFCFMCDTLVYYHKAACITHAPIYQQHKDEQWCKELVQAEHKQGYISSKECVDIIHVASSILPTLYDQSRAKERVNIKDKILELNQTGMKPKAISAQLNIKLNTVNVILYRHRRALKKNRTIGHKSLE